MDEKNGRCAILLPHGVLAREEENEIRQKFVESDLLECVIGIGRNLFYNSPMEACVMICRANKMQDRKNKILFVDAKDLVMRKNGESYLEHQHIQEIVKVFNNYKTISGFSCCVDIKQVKSNNSHLSVPLYVKRNADVYYDVLQDYKKYNAYLEELNIQITNLQNIFS
jgi:type I restriction enzyme M protein